MTSAQRNAISSPVAGMIIYNTSSQNINIYNGTTWVSTSASTPITTWSLNGNTVYYISGNVGIGTNTPNAKAALEVSSNTQGFLPPRMTLAQRNAISAPIPAGMVIYNTNTNELNVYNGTAWVSAASSSNLTAKDYGFAYLSVPQLSNLAINDHVEFNQIEGNNKNRHHSDND
jgi:hypothetical protein